MMVFWTSFLPMILSGIGGCIVPTLQTITQSKIEPADRAKVDRQAEAVSEDVITGAS